MTDDGLPDLHDGNWITPAQAAYEACKSIGTIYVWLRSDSPPGVMVGGRYYVDRRLLLARRRRS